MFLHRDKIDLIGRQSRRGMIAASLMGSSRKLFTIIVASLFVLQGVSGATDTLDWTQTITDGETLVSSGGMFRMGFFSPGKSSYRYLGLWYNNLTVHTVVWVANRATPLTNKTGVLRVVRPGLLVLSDDANHTVWSSNASRSAQNPVAQLLDDGNIVVRDADADRAGDFLWQSFDYPTDTYLPGMKFGWNLLTGLEVYLLSWTSADDPAPGQFSYHLDPTGYPQILLKNNGSKTFRIGPWNGNRFSGIANVRIDPTFNLTFVMNKNEVVYWENAIDKTVISRKTVGLAGLVQRLSWVERMHGWMAYVTLPSDRCDAYALCGVHGFCDIGNSPSCGCLDRFVPKDPVGWVQSDWTGGCVRRANLSCQGDVFLKYSGVKLPDAMYSWYHRGITLKECERECSRNCTCMAYAQLDVNQGSGCLFWHGNLIDMRFVSSDGQDIYIRLASSESNSRRKRRGILVASLAATGGAILIALGVFLCIRLKGGHLKANEEGSHEMVRDKDSELRSFDLSIILKATDHFSPNNKLGEGGFGPVYKGILEEGQQIAVKRLSKDSMQGCNEFKNEVIFIAKLQHRNLVRLLGCCIQGDENLLVYEYLPNKSLNVMLFDGTKKPLLDWSTRFKIINGIARGLLYLHQDSRLRIIHRDLKASNVLLDVDMTPKISDFGLARSFGGNETEAKTCRVVGTYGYMSPEYAVDGLFSIKSDVFSFGVLVLEIISGKRNRGFSHGDHSLNLLGHAWTLHNEGRSLDLVDNSLGNSLHFEEAIRSIHVGLLCVQKSPEDRPTMSSVVLMLGNEGALPPAQQPGFFLGRDTILNVRNSTSSNSANSKNGITITMLEGR